MRLAREVSRQGLRDFSYGRTRAQGETPQRLSRSNPPQNSTQPPRASAMDCGGLTPPFLRPAKAHGSEEGNGSQPVRDLVLPIGKRGAFEGAARRRQAAALQGASRGATGLAGPTTYRDRGPSLFPSSRSGPTATECRRSLLGHPRAYYISRSRRSSIARSRSISNSRFLTLFKAATVNVMGYRSS